MKKTLLTLLVVMASILGMSAATTEFGYCGEFNQIIGVGRKCVYSLAIEVPAEYSAAMKGSQITAVRVGFGDGVNKNMSVFVSKNLEQGMTMLGSGSTDKLEARKINEISLDTPVELTGEKLYAGFIYESTSAKDYPLGFDAEPGYYSPLGDFASIKTTADELWNELGIFGKTQYGNPYIQIVIEGENFPAEMAMARAITLPSIIRPWTDFNFDVTVRNLGSAPMNSVEISYRLGGSGILTYTHNFETPLAPDATGVVTLTGRNNQDGEVDLPASAYVSKVNGVNNPLATVGIVETTFSPNSKWFERRMVMEEYTGLACGWCPRGYYGIEEFSKKMKEAGTEDNFIAIAVHNYGSDPMACSAYNSWVNKYVKGAPSGTINRMEGFLEIDPSLETLEASYPLIHALCKEDVQISAEFEDEEQTNVVATTTMQFAEDIKNAAYGLAYVIIQNNVGPYNQSNFYSGGKQGEMGGFENLGAMTPLVYNDVARDIYNWSGDKTAVPSEIVEGETYTHTKVMALSRCKTLKGASLDNVEIVVLLIDRKTDEIVNAAKCKIGGSSVNAVKEVETPSFTVRGLSGRIVVDGNYDNVVLYTADGAVAGRFAAGQPINVAAGLYLVSVDSEKAVKVIVR